MDSTISPLHLAPLTKNHPPANTEGRAKPISNSITATTEAAILKIWPLIAETMNISSTQKITEIYDFVESAEGKNKLKTIFGLNLSNRELTEFPEYLTDHLPELHYLDLSHNHFKSPSKFPPKLLYLFMENNPLVHFPQHLPSTLTHLRISTVESSQSTKEPTDSTKSEWNKTASVELTQAERKFKELRLRIYHFIQNKELVEPPKVDCLPLNLQDLPLDQISRELKITLWKQPEEMQRLHNDSQKKLLTFLYELIDEKYSTESLKKSALLWEAKTLFIGQVDENKIENFVNTLFDDKNRYKCEEYLNLKKSCQEMKKRMNGIKIINKMWVKSKKINDYINYLQMSPEMFLHRGLPTERDFPLLLKYLDFGQETEREFREPMQHIYHYCMKAVDLTRLPKGDELDHEVRSLTTKQLSKWLMPLWEEIVAEGHLKKLLHHLESAKERGEKPEILRDLQRKYMLAKSHHDGFNKLRERPILLKEAKTIWDRSQQLKKFWDQYRTILLERNRITVLFTQEATAQETHRSQPAKAATFPQEWNKLLKTIPPLVQELEDQLEKAKLDGGDSSKIDLLSSQLTQTQIIQLQFDQSISTIPNNRLRRSSQ